MHSPLTLTDTPHTSLPPPHIPPRPHHTHTQTTLQPPAPLTINSLFSTLQQIAAEKGAGSAVRRTRAVLRMLRAAREQEPKYLVRTLVSNLRVCLGGCM